MKHSDARQILKSAAVEPAEGLPKDFSIRVLEKARLIRRDAKIHMRLLQVASILALIGAAVVSYRLSLPTKNSPPSMPVFDSGSTLFSISNEGS